MPADPPEGTSPREPGLTSVVGRVWTEVWKAAITISLGVAAAVIITPWVQSILTAPSCDDPRGLHLVDRAQLRARATSENPHEDNADYFARFAIDGDSSTSWVEGRSDTDPHKFGEGERIRISLDRPRDVQLVCVINGYAKTEALYLHNARIRELTTTTEGGSVDSVLPEKPLEHFAGYQFVRVVPGRTHFVSLEIGTARAGQDAGQEADTAISEIELWAADT